MSRLIKENHGKIRGKLRIIGPSILAVGVLCMIVALIDFFMAFGGSGSPDLFWLFFIGAPLMFVGGVMTSMAFMGAVARYQACEVAPVGKDTFNYMAQGTKDSVRDLAGAVGEGLGLREGDEDDNVERPAICPACDEPNDHDARFCRKCGGSITQAKVCEDCGEKNDPSASFCDNCGRKLDE